MMKNFCRVCAKKFVPVDIIASRFCTRCTSEFTKLKPYIITNAKMLALKNKALLSKIRALELDVAKLTAKCFQLAQK